MSWGKRSLCTAGLVAALAALPSAAEAPAAGEGADECLACHADPAFTLELEDGSSVSLHVDPAEFEGSIHHGLVSCSACHPGTEEFPHPDWPRKNRSEFQAGFRQACKDCHPDEYARSLDGVHEALFVKGEAAAPGCSDCHGAHKVTSPASSRTAISDTCSGCHYDVAELYQGSVHGQALYERASDDAPVCTDCHRSHDIPDPSAMSWRVREPEMCGDCHTDPVRMGKYGLSTDVLQTYLADFHGTTARLSGARTGNEVDRASLAALCTDCHGVHDIRKVDDPDSPVLKANLAETCRKCHEGASDSFPSAWLLHYTPSWENAPMVKAVEVFYKLFIPFMIGGLVCQVLLHLWRVVVNR